MDATISNKGIQYSEAINKYLNTLCDSDERLGAFLLRGDNREQSIEALEEILSQISTASSNQQLPGDILDATVKFLQHKSEYRYKVTDFFEILTIANLQVISDAEKRGTDWWDSAGEHYKLRINEIFNTFLMIREMEL